MTVLTAPFALSSLPSHPRDAGREGYIYAVELSTGVVKVGKSRNPRARVSAHIDSAACYGIAVMNVWLSPRHTNYSENETLLIAGLGAAEYRNEYFRTSFAEVVQAANRLQYRVATEEERDSWMAASQRRTQEMVSHLGLGSHLISVPNGMQAVFVADDVMAWPLRLIFSRELPDAPRHSPSDDLEPLVDDLAKRLDKTVEEILDWSFIEIMDHLLGTIIKAQLLDLQYRALLNGRYDLTDPCYWGDALKAGSL